MQNPRPLALAALAAAFACTCCSAVQKSDQKATDYDAIVVGAGMGGLSAATHMAARGMNVLLLEQHYKVGGCTTSFERGDFKFDAALHEMSVGGGREKALLFTLLEQAGIRDKVELIRIPDLGRSIFPGFEFTSPAGEDEYVAALSARWPDEADGAEKFRDLMSRVHDEISELRTLYLGNPVKAMLTKLALPLRQRTLFKYRVATLEEVLDETFEDPEIKAVASQFWNYHGPPPRKQWAIIYLAANYGYLINGAWQIKGSSQALSDAYAARIAELGGTVMTDSRVSRILVEDGAVGGVETEAGERFTAPYVVSNADPYQTFYRLVGRENTPRKMLRKLEEMEPSNSLVGVYLGLDVPIEHFGVRDYEIFVNTSLDANAMYDAAMAGRYEEGFESVTLYSNLDDPFYAPPGKSVVTINTYSNKALWPEPGPAYEAQKRKMMDALILMAERVLPGLREHIEVEVGMTPRTIESFTLNHDGVPYGWNFTPEQHARMDIPTDIDGLYMAGAWTWPAHSVGMAQVSGYMAARMIVNESGRGK
ncbi:MAG: NAD(P)/FAD-dependent oxidoreductase [Proteobacteria bacterium]|nr:NAD(P)/FAD-dependent oxidoreductase [Pseudomonadota bacterium]